MDLLKLVLHVGRCTYTYRYTYTCITSFNRSIGDRGDEGPRPKLVQEVNLEQKFLNLKPGVIV